MKNLFLTIMAFGLLLTSCQKDGLNSSNFSDSIESREKHELCIETYNTYLLDAPDPLGIDFEGPQCEGEDCIRRAQAICERATAGGADIINLQEVWIGGDARKTLIDCLKSKGYNVLEDANCDGGGWFNEDNDCTGLLTATKLEVVSTEIEFFDCGTGWDKHKEKGFQLNKLKLESGCFIYNLNTHLQADDDEDAIECRLKQLEEIKNRIRLLPYDVPLYMAGDFNIDYTSFDYRHLLQLGTSAYQLIGATPVTNTSNQTLDYIFIRDAKNNTTNITTRNMEFYIVITCPPPSKPIPGYKESETFGPFKSMAELLEFSKLNGLPEPGQIGNCRVYHRAVDTGTLENVSDHIDITICLEYDCEDQTNSIEFTPVDNTLCDPNMSQWDCIANGGQFLNGRCICN